MDFGEWEKIVNHTLSHPFSPENFITVSISQKQKSFNEKNITAKKFILISSLDFKNAMRAFAEA